MLFRSVQNQVERGAVAVEIGFIVEQRIDHLFGETGFPAGDEGGDELVQRADGALSHQRLQRRLDAPAAADRQLLAGPGFEQALQDAAGGGLRLPGVPLTRSTLITARSGGGRSAWASPAPASRRG